MSFGTAPAPEDEGSELWKKLKDAPLPAKEFNFPRVDLAGKHFDKVAIRVLKEGEQTAAFIEAHKYTLTRMKDAEAGEAGYDVVFASAARIEVLYRACREPHDHTKLAFRTLNQLRSLANNEIETLFAFYETVLEELRPEAVVVDAMSAVEWAERLVSEDSAAALNLLTEEERNALALAMAKLIAGGDERDESAPAAQAEQESERR